MKNLFLILSLIFSVSVFGKTFLRSEIKTGTYTVPSGKIAIIIPRSGDITINGTHAGGTSTASWGASAGSPGTVTHKYSQGPGYYCWDAFTVSGVGTHASKAISLKHYDATVNIGSSTAATASFSAGCVEGTGLALVSSGYDCCTTGYYTNSNTTVKFIPTNLILKAKSSDVINGTKYIVELYER